MKTILLDTETTGTDVGGESEVIEIAWTDIDIDFTIPYANFNNITVQRFQPRKPSQWGALAVHHILPEELEGQPPSLDARIPEGVAYLIGHNIDFDWKALNSPPCKRICTLALCRHFWPNVDSHTLTSMTYFLRGPIPATRNLLKNAHSAEVDVENNFYVLQRILTEGRPRSMEEFWKLSERARIPTKMAFGKHKGKSISEVDKGYATWYSRQEDPDPYLLQAFRAKGLLPPERK